VILHSYFLRALFDHGVLGLVLLFSLLWLGLRRSGTGARDALAVLTLISVSGLSVSAFNNVFASMVLAVAMGLDRSGQRGDPLVPEAGHVPTARPRSALGGRPVPRAPLDH